MNNATIKRNQNGTFAKGNKSGHQFTAEELKGNQFAKGNKPNEHTFGIKDVALTKHPQWTGGIQYNTNDCIHIAIGNGKKIRRPRLLYEQYYKNKIPKGYIVYHKDGNKHNDNKENIIIITRAELLKINRNK